MRFNGPSPVHRPADTLSHGERVASEASRVRVKGKSYPCMENESETERRLKHEPAVRGLRKE